MEIKFDEYDIYIKPGVTDLRKRSESLSFLIRSEMKLNPLEKSIFLFCSKNRKKVVALLWDGNGYLEISKKLACYGRFKWPQTKEAATKVSADDVRSMLKGQNPWLIFPVFNINNSLIM